MRTTGHARKRGQQRGFSRFTMEIIERIGRPERAPGGATIIHLGKRESQEAIDELKRAIKAVDRARGGSLVINGGSLVTVYKRRH